MLTETQCYLLHEGHLCEVIEELNVSWSCDRNPVCRCLLDKGAGVLWWWLWHLQELTGFWHDCILTVRSKKSLHFSGCSAIFFCWLLFQAIFVLVLPGAAASPAPSESVRSVLAFVALWNFLQPCDWTDRQGFLFVVLFVVVLFAPPSPWSFAHLLWENGGAICFPQEKKVFVPKEKLQTRPKQLISMTMRPPIFSLLTNAGTLPKLT